MLALLLLEEETSQRCCRCPPASRGFSGLTSATPQRNACTKRRHHQRSRFRCPPACFAATAVRCLHPYQMVNIVAFCRKLFMPAILPPGIRDGAVHSTPTGSQARFGFTAASFVHPSPGRRRALPSATPAAMLQALSALAFAKVARLPPGGACRMRQCVAFPRHAAAVHAASQQFALARAEAASFSCLRRREA